MPKRGFTRRRFLRGAGGAALALPLLPSLMGPAFGQTPTFPKRLVVIGGWGSDYRTGFTPSGGYGRNFSLQGTYLEPLEGALIPNPADPSKMIGKYRNRMIIGHGLKDWMGHVQGQVQMLTGQPSKASPDFDAKPELTGQPIPGDAANFVPMTGQSVDQYILTQLKNGGVRMPLPEGLHLNLVRQNTLNSGYGALSWGLTPENTPRRIPVIQDPKQAFEAVFGKISGGTPQPPGDEAMKVRMKKSLLDALVEDYRSLNASLPNSERHLLDSHLTYLREQEESLAEPPPPLTCNKDDYPTPGTSEDWAVKTAHHMKTMFAALRCDATRVVTFGFGTDGASDDSSSFRFLYNGVANTDPFWHGINHFDERFPGSAESHRRVRLWESDQLRKFLDDLDSIPEGDGTLLDNTMVVRIIDLTLHHESDTHGRRPYTHYPNNNHGRYDIPFIVVGGAGGALDTGQYINYEGRPYSDLLVTIAHAMGFPVATFGRNGTQPFSELLKV